MLEILFSSHDLLNTLHLIYKDSVKHKKQNYELLTIEDADGYTIKLPYSDRSLYNLYVIISRNIKTEFYRLIANDKETLEKFEYLKSHTSTLTDTMEEILKSEKDSFITKNKVFIFIRSLLTNEKLIEQYHDYKLKNMMDNIIGEEEGLLDTYYIYLLLSDFTNEVDIDMMDILVKSVNSYNIIVSYQTKSKYPIINDFGTAQIYLNKIAMKTYRSTTVRNSKSKCTHPVIMSRFPNRLYNKFIQDLSLKAYIKKQFRVLNGRIFFELGIFGLIPTIILSLVFSFNPLLLWLVPYGLIILYRIIRKNVLMKRLDQMMKIENCILKPLSDTERFFINNQYKI